MNKLKNINRLILQYLACVGMCLVCFVARAAEYKVSSASEINALPTLFPGDMVILKNGTWEDQAIVFKGKGTEAEPIVLKAETAGQVILTGSSTLSIAGDYLQVESLKFANGNAGGSVIEFRRGSVLANHCRLTNTTIVDYSPSDKTVDSKWVSLYGTYNRVDHCSFSGKTNQGTTLVVWMDNTPDNHLIEYNYFGPRPVLGTNGGESIRIGTSDWVEYESNTIVEFNLFDECDGETEIISNKSVGNQYRYNTFLNCDGTLTLRHGSYCKVYGNFFFGDPTKNSGGIRVIGEGHEVYNNYLEGLNGTSYRAAISLVDGIPDSPPSGYYQVKKARIAFNTIVDCKQPFAIGAGKDSQKTLPPVETLIANNLVIGRSGYPVIADYDTTDGITWDTNMADADELGISTTDGFYLGTIGMEKKDGLYRPIQGSVVVGKASSVLAEINDDIDGQERPQNRDIGCDQLLSQAISIHPLKKEEVGASYLVSSLPESSIQKPMILSGKESLTIVFTKAKPRKFSLWALDGRKLSQFEETGSDLKLSYSGSPDLVILRVEEDSKSYSLKLIR